MLDSKQSRFGAQQLKKVGRATSEAANLPESVFIYQITVNLYRTLVYLHLSYNVLNIKLMLSLPHKYRYNSGGDN